MTLGVFNQYLWMDFFGGFNTTGTTIVNTLRWFHVVFVYDQIAQQQFIYLDGLESGRSAFGSTPPYLGTCQSVRIGNNFIGLIDQLSISNRVKSPREILTEASLVAWYSFDGDLSDSGPNELDGSGTTRFNASGRLGQALALTANDTLFQATGFTILTIPNQAFSISLWLKPRSNIGQNTLMTFSSSNWCMQLLGFSSSGSFLFKINGVSSAVGSLSTTQWTHVAYTYSAVNGVQFFINGNLVQNLRTVITPSTLAPTLTIGGQPSSAPLCPNVPGRYEGLIDEVKIYNRELSSVEIDDLANI